MIFAWLVSSWAKGPFILLRWRELFFLCGDHFKGRKPTEDSRLYLIHFYHVIDLRKVILGGPRSFNNCILLIHQLSRGENPELAEFYHADFWVQVHGLPHGFVSQDLARSLGSIFLVCMTNSPQSKIQSERCGDCVSSKQGTTSKQSC